MFGGRAMPVPAERGLALPRLHFLASNAPKRLAAVLRPDPLGEVKRPLRAPRRSEGQIREHSLAAVTSALRRGGVTEVRVGGRRLIRRT